MHESRFIRTWRDAARDLELHVTPWRVVLLPTAKCLVADLWIDGFGSPRGMLLFGHAAQLESSARVLVREGWAHTVLGPERDVVESHADIMRRLRGWGWYGAPERKPTWLVDA